MSGKRLVQWTVTAVFAIIIFCVVNFHKNLIQAYNLKTVLHENLDGRLVPHRVNSIEKFKRMQDCGIRSLEVDLYFDADTNRRCFAIGHDIEDARSVNLDEYLESLGQIEIRKIWLDIKNVTADHLQPMLQELERLDSLYEIRDIAIVESSYPSRDITIISDAGFHLSYYLPTERNQKLLDTEDEEILDAEAAALAEQLDNQRVSAISFDLSLYPFVKEYLEPVLSDTIVYHTWGAIKLWEWGTITKLRNTVYFKDSRVKTILYRYWE